MAEKIFISGTLIRRRVSKDVLFTEEQVWWEQNSGLLSPHGGFNYRVSDEEKVLRIA